MKNKNYFLKIKKDNRQYLGEWKNAKMYGFGISI